jgi:16S rRNA (adenine1518-N6/adenine1519-N6)-dimethyltransferase
MNDEQGEKQPAQASVRQTQSYLLKLFGGRGIRPKNKLGQNFLIDLNLMEVLLRGAELSRDDLALEVGSGTGGLTARLADLAGGVVSVELDTAFAALAGEAVAGRDNVTLLHADVLRNKNEITPDVLRAVDGQAARLGTKCVKLVANLPYAVAVPVLANLLAGDRPPERMVATVQWEIAERLTARPGTKDYGALAVLAQSLADVEVLRRLPPSAFWPRPKVFSAIVRVRPDAEGRARVGDVRAFRAFLRELYAHRRKGLRGALLGFHGRPFSKPEVDARLAGLGIDGGVRAEALDPGQHLLLCRAFAAGPQ